MVDDFNEKMKIFREYLIVRAKSSADTIDKYTRFTKEFLDFVSKNYGVTKILEVSPKHLVEWIKYLTKKGYSGNTINLKRSAVIKFFDALYNEEPDNPDLQNKVILFKNVHGIGKVDSNQHEPIPVEWLPKLKDASLTLDEKFGSTEHYTAFMFFLYTGGRSQLYGVLVDEIDFENHWLETFVKRGKYIKIPLHPHLEKVIKWHLKNRDYDSPYLFKHGKYPYADIYINKNKKGFEKYRDVIKNAEKYNIPRNKQEEKRNRDSNRKNVSILCNRIRKEARFNEPLYPHRFRETLHYEFEELGVSINTAMAIGGWSSEDMAYYYRRTGKHVKKALKEFEKIDLLNIKEGDENEL